MSQYYGDPRVEALERALGEMNALTQRMRRQIAGLEAERRLTRAGRVPRRPIEFRSQYGEDLFLYDLLGQQENGFYIEVGAYDGVQLSVSSAFDAMGWSGLLIEALPEPVAACRANRPQARVVHAALVAPDGPAEVTFTLTEGDPLFSYHEIASPLHERIVRENGGVRRQITVPATTMDALLADHTGAIDFASLDVEGGEAALLKGFDLARHRPRVLLIEDGAEARSSPVLEHMSRHPEYEYVANLPGIRVFIRRDDSGLMERAKLMRLGRL